MTDNVDPPPCAPEPCGPEKQSPLRSALKMVGEPGAPLEVGRFEVDETEGLRMRDSSSPLAFRFVFRGVPFDVKVTTGENAALKLSGDLGCLPFTAQSSSGRQFLRALVQSAGSLRFGQIVLKEDGAIHLESETSPPVPRTPVSVMACVVAVLLDIKPYLEAITEILGLAAPPPAEAP